jgi:hypothetical protein
MVRYHKLFKLCVHPCRSNVQSMRYYKLNLAWKTSLQRGLFDLWSVHEYRGILIH